MRKINTLEYLTGFLMGIFFGVFLDSVLFILFNLIYPMARELPIAFSWWMIIFLIPLPLVCGMIMGSGIASLHLEDF